MTPETDVFHFGARDQRGSCRGVRHSHSFLPSLIVSGLYLEVQLMQFPRITHTYIDVSLDVSVSAPVFLEWILLQCSPPYSPSPSPSTSLSLAVSLTSPRGSVYESPLSC